MPVMAPITALRFMGNRARYRGPYQGVSPWHTACNSYPRNANHKENTICTLSYSQLLSWLASPAPPSRPCLSRDARPVPSCRTL